VSLQNIKNNFEEIQDVILATSNFFSDMNGNILIIQNQKRTECVFLEKIKDTDVCLNGVGHRYKFVSEDYPKLRQNNFETVKNCFLALELCDCMFSTDMNILSLEKFPVLSAYREFVSNKIFDKTTGTFKTSFIDGTDVTLSEFRDAINEIILNLKSDQKSGVQDMFTNSKTTDTWRYLKKNLYNSNLAHFFNVLIDQQASNITGDEMDYNIIEFFDKFVYLVDVDIGTIKEAIQHKLKSTCGSEQLLELFCEVLESKIKSAVAVETSELPITEKTVKRIIENLELLNLDIHSMEIFKKYGHVEFKFPISGWDAGLLNHKILCFVTPQDETFITCIKIYQYLKSLSKKFIFVRTDDTSEHREKCLSVFQNYVDCCLLEVNADLDKFSLYEDKFFDAAKTKNLIIVTHRIDFTKRLSECKLMVQNAALCNELTETSLEQILDKTVEFQGTETSLKSLLNPEFLKFAASSLRISEILDLTDIAKTDSTSPSNLSLYIPRIILQVQQVYLKTKLLKDWEDKKFLDIITFSNVPISNDFVESIKEYENIARILKSEFKKFDVQLVLQI
jgi:hypothetical protein